MPQPISKPIILPAILAAVLETVLNSWAGDISSLIVRLISSLAITPVTRASVTTAACSAPVVLFCMLELYITFLAAFSATFFTMALSRFFLTPPVSPDCHVLLLFTSKSCTGISCSTNSSPITASPVMTAFSSASSREAPFHLLWANARAILMPIVSFSKKTRPCPSIIKWRILPDFAICRACIYVNAPCLSELNSVKYKDTRSNCSKGTST